MAQPSHKSVAKVTFFIPLFDQAINHTHLLSFYTMEDLKGSGTCVCGKVEVNVTGKPVVAAFCHCLDCQRAHSAPIFHAIIFPLSQVGLDLLFCGDLTTTLKVTFSFPQGGDFDDNIQKIHITEEGPDRLTCRSCGARLGNRRERSGRPTFCAVPAQILRTQLPAEYKPVMHVCYSERCVNIIDGLPKYAKLPAAWGGSDDLIAEE